MHTCIIWQRHYHSFRLSAALLKAVLHRFHCWHWVINWWFILDRRWACYPKIILSHRARITVVRQLPPSVRATLWYSVLLFKEKLSFAVSFLPPCVEKELHSASLITERYISVAITVFPVLPVDCDGRRLMGSRGKERIGDVHKKFQATLHTSYDFENYILI